VARQKAHSSQLKSGFNLGGEQAEADPLLDRAFLEWSGYTVVESRTDPHCFLVMRRTVERRLGARDATLWWSYRIRIAAK